MSTQRSATVEERLEREREYHDMAFAEGVRAPTDKYYETIKRTRDRFQELITHKANGLKVLEYGCGPGSHAYMMAKAGADVTGIDISPVAVDMATEEAQRQGVPVTFTVMNAEALEFADRSFDRILGSAILHHLDLRRSYSELARTLKDDGEAVFIEPMGHNPIINLYRRLTPKMRTVDEHPMLMRDIQLAREYFGEVDVEYFNLLGIGSVIARGTPLFKPLLSVLDGIDRLLFTLIPPTRRWAWMAVMIFRFPRRDQGSNREP